MAGITEEYRINCGWPPEPLDNMQTKFSDNLTIIYRSSILLILCYVNHLTTLQDELCYYDLIKVKTMLTAQMN